MQVGVVHRGLDNGNRVPVILTMDACTHGVFRLSDLATMSHDDTIIWDRMRLSKGFVTILPIGFVFQTKPILLISFLYRIG